MSKFSVVVVNKNFNPADIETNVLSGMGTTIKVVEAIDKKDVIKECKNADAILLSAAPHFDKEVIDALTNCKCIVRYGVGTDNVDKNSVKANGIILSNVPIYGHSEVALHTLTLILTLFRKINKSNSEVKNGIWGLNTIKPIKDHHETSIGIIGLGKIGQKVGEFCENLGFKLIGFDPFVTYEDLSNLDNIKLASTIDELVEKSNIITLHVGLNKNTKKLVNNNFLKKLLPGSYIINCSRGELLDEFAVLDALNSGNLQGVGLDVLSTEPPGMDNKLIMHPNVLITPHMAWYSEGAEIRLREQAAQEVKRILLNKEPKNRVA